MRILHLTATYPPSINGVAFYVKLLADTQRLQGHEVLVYAPRHPQAPHPEIGVLRFPALPTPIAPNYPLGSPITIPKKIKRFQPEIIHAHHPFNFGYYALHLGRQCHARVYITHHTQYQIYVNTYLKRAAPPVNWLVNQHLLHLYRSLDGIICPTLAIQKTLVDQGVARAKHIPNGIDLDHFAPSPSPPSKPHFIYAGRLEKEKHPELLIHLAALLQPALPNFKLTLVGTGRLLNGLRNLVNNQHLTTSVSLTGPIPRTQLPNLLKKHSLFISFSESEVMPLTYIEALACGLPICVTQAGLIPGLLTPQNSLTLNSDLSIAAKQLINLSRHPATLKHLSTQASLSAKHFSIKTTAHQIMAFYHNSSS